MTEGPGPRPLLQVGVTWAGVLVFALFVNRPSPYFLLAIAGLLFTTLAIASSADRGGSFWGLFGITRPSTWSARWTLLALVVGAAFAFFFRWYEGRPLLITGLGSFLLMGASIGAAEELLFRGYLQGRLSRLGAPAAIVLATLAHTSYKTLLFAFPPEGVVIRYSILAFFTFLVGAFLGITRQRTGSVIPALSGHVLFDILVYGDWAQAPWWVWGTSIP